MKRLIISLATALLLLTQSPSYANTSLTIQANESDYQEFRKEASAQGYTTEQIKDIEKSLLSENTGTTFYSN